MDIQHNDLPQILTAREVANALKISRAFAYQLMRTQQIRTVNIGRAVRVLREDLADFINKSAPPKMDNP
jgi:excisionase family DNA binding protein